MNRTKKGAKLLVLLLAVFQIAQVAAGAFSDDVSFSDVSADDWYAQDVATCAKFEIVKGYEDGTFKPEKNVTRGEFMEDVDIKKYVFEVAKDANKIEIKKAVEEIFGVTVIKVTTTHATNHLDNPNKISAVRRDIARVKTVIREKELEQ